MFKYKRINNKRIHTELLEIVVVLFDSFLIIFINRRLDKFIEFHRIKFEQIDTAL
jgi:hypothetical protein